MHLFLEYMILIKHLYIKTIVVFFKRKGKRTIVINIVIYYMKSRGSLLGRSDPTINIYN